MLDANRLMRGGWVKGVALGILVSGCAGFQVRNSPGPEGAGPAGERRLLSVPFFSDDGDQCGPAALAGVLAYWGYPADPAALKSEVYLPRLKGSLAMDLLLAAQTRGFTARIYDGSLENLKAELEKGRPLVAFINRGLDFLPTGHYVVISGYDDALGGVYVHSGESQNKFVRYERFFRDWDKTYRTTLMILPQGHEGESL